MKKRTVRLWALLVCLLFLTAAPVMAQDYCKGDFEYDGDVDADDVTEFLNHFGRSQYNNPCPLDGPAAVETTGQTTCYDETGITRDCIGTGEDGDYQQGLVWPKPRFTDKGNGTVADNLTGLTWLKDANCIATNYSSFDNDGTAGNGGVLWQHALDFVTGINDGTYPDCGAVYTDWRLPNVKELLSLIHYGYLDPPLCDTEGTGQWTDGNPFNNLQNGYYWSSNSRTGYPEMGWRVSMNHGGARGDSKLGRYDFVWPVRGGR